MIFYLSSKAIISLSPGNSCLLFLTRQLLYSFSQKTPDFPTALYVCFLFLPRQCLCFRFPQTTAVLYVLIDNHCFLFHPDKSFFLTSFLTTVGYCFFPDNSGLLSYTQTMAIVLFLTANYWFLFLPRRHLLFIIFLITAFMPKYLPTFVHSDEK